MKANPLNIILVTIVSALLAWWLWSMGVTPTHRLLLCLVGGFVMEVGFVGAFGFYYPYPRSGSQVRLIYTALGVCAFAMSCIYSFTLFEPAAYCVPIGLMLVFSVMAATKVYRSKM